MYCFAKFCRLCLKESETLVLIFGGEDDKEIGQKLIFLRPEFVSLSDNLQFWICSSCETQIKETFIVFKKWLKAYNTLQKCINKYESSSQKLQNVIFTLNEIECNLHNEEIDNFRNNSKITSYKDSIVQTNLFNDTEMLRNVFKKDVSTQTILEELEKHQNGSSVIEDLIEIVKLSEDIQQLNTAENLSDKSDVLEELIEIAISKSNQNDEFSKNEENSNIEVSTNILEKAIEISEIEENSDLEKQPSLLEKDNFFPNSFISESVNETCNSLLSEISNELNYDSCLINSSNEVFFPTNFSNSENNCQFNSNSVDLAEVQKISGYLQESYSKNSVFCNLDDNIYDENCDTLINNILNNNLNNKELIQLSYTQDKPNNEVQVSLIDTWNVVNEDILPKEHLVLLDNEEKKLDSLLFKNTQNSDFSEYCNSEIYNKDYLLYSNDCNSISGSFSENTNQSSSTLSSTENTPTQKKNFNFPEKGSKKYVKKKNNSLQSKFYQLFQDMEIASRHCNTPVESVILSSNAEIIYSIDRNNSSYSCVSCNITFKTINLILEHGQVHGTIQDLCENEYLLKNTKNPEKSVKILVNHDTKMFRCKKCDKNYSEFAALYRHVSVHVSNQSYSCEECGKSFPVYRYLSLHKLTHNRIKVYACKLCPKTFRAKDTLKTHEIVHHENNDKSYICDLCGKAFALEQHLKYHMNRHNKETGRICHICGKILKNEELCYRHIKETHLVISFKECEVCHKTFHNNRNLKAHMKLHGTKDFKCDECDKEFFFNRDLKNHKLLHTGGKPHSCDHCGKRFRVLGALYKHRRTHKAKPYVCKTCQKGFHQLKSLQVHERIHSGVKPYKCEECDKSYVHINVYFQHMKKFHSEVMTL